MDKIDLNKKGFKVIQKLCLESASDQSIANLFFRTTIRESRISEITTSGTEIRV